MSQAIVLSWLKEHPNRWFTSKQIAKELNAGTSPIITNLARLRKTSFIEWKYDRNPKSKDCYFYLYKK